MTIQPDGRRADARARRTQHQTPTLEAGGGCACNRCDRADAELFPPLDEFFAPLFDCARRVLPPPLPRLTRPTAAQVRARLASKSPEELDQLYCDGEVVYRRLLELGLVCGPPRPSA
jgi:hypothetical protein